jgi:magnesium-transporting ATPase (P-type)
MLKRYVSAGDHQKLLNVKEVSRETTLCLAAAHALAKLDDGTTVGDPMEKTTLDALEWSLKKGVSHCRINHSFNGLLLNCSQVIS